ncbi:hypothetical protein CAAN3_19S00254 [[Candida] anglica]
MSYKYPRVSIEYCAKCKWNNRAVWYVQELIQTFDKPGVNLIEEVAIQPRYDYPGLFRVTVSKDAQNSSIIYERKFQKDQGTEPTKDYSYEGFPDSKFLKTLVRDYLFPDNKLGHIDRANHNVLNRGEECVPCAREN